MKMAADGSQISLTRRNKPGTKAKVSKNRDLFNWMRIKSIFVFNSRLSFYHLPLISLELFDFSFCLGCLHCQQYFQHNSRTVFPLKVIAFTLQDYCRWPDEPFEEMDSTLAVQQYIQQLIKNDPSNIDLILTNPETHDEGVWKYEHLRLICALAVAIIYLKKKHL